MIKDIRHFTKELNLITDPNLRNFVSAFLMHAPDYFWTIGASASGKYHPGFTKGEGGLVRHVKAAVRMADELMNLSQFGYMPDEYKDYAMAAIIIHDCYKYGPGPDIDRKKYANHGRECAIKINELWWNLYGDFAPDLLVMAVNSHMGQWHGPEEQKPFTPIDRLVHLADYISSRSFIDIPGLMEEWEEIAAIDTPFEGDI